MAENSKISWTDDTFNPWWGCKRVGPGCDNCYAADLDKRTGGSHWDSEVLPRRTSAQNWRLPLKWNKKAEESGVRRKVFCASMADVFDNRIPSEWREDLWQLIRTTPNLDWIIVTKRIGNALAMLPSDWGNGYSNVWLLATVVTQKEADRDIPKLINTPAAIRGLSVEPQIELIELPKLQGAIHWVICGAESGPKRRAFDLDWARKLRNQSLKYGAAFFLKQIPGNTRKGTIETPVLDGRQWIEFPA